MFVYESRAVTILYNVLRSRKEIKPFLMPANICPVVPLTFLKAGQPFELVDIQRKSLAMDFKQVARQISSNHGHYGGLIYAHPFGDPSSIESTFKQLKELDPNLFLIDDCCLCAPCFMQPVSTAADLILYSTGYAKYVDLGLGGFAWMADGSNYSSINLPYKKDDYQFLMNDVKKAIDGQVPFYYKNSNWLDFSIVKIPWSEYQQLVISELERTHLHRNTLNQIYSKLIPKPMQIQSQFQNWRFNIQVANQKEILEKIFSGGLFASCHYASLGVVFSPLRFPISENLAGKIINLFNDHHYTIEMAERTAIIIRNNATVIKRDAP